MIIRLELTTEQAELLREHVDETIAQVVATEPDTVSIAFFNALRKLRLQLGGKGESVTSTRGTLRGARRVP